MAIKRTHEKKQAENKGTDKMTRKRRLLLFCCLFFVLGIFAMVLFFSRNYMGQMRQKDGYYEIWSKEDYKKFWEMVCNQPECNGRLMCDLTLNEWSDLENWAEKPPENRSVKVEAFSGIFDGNGHSISGLYSENGYGMVKDNLGTIKDLTIKNSMITGGDSGQGSLQGNYFNSGICYRNYRQVQNCRFEGVLCDKEYHSARAAGICIINYGIIEKCVYKGTMQYVWTYWVYSDRAGICTENRGKVSSCCNLSEEMVEDKGYYTEKPEDCFAYPIADEGMENCYVVEGSYWGMLKKEPVIALSSDQMYALPWLLEEDFYPLLEKGLELPFADGRLADDKLDKDRFGTYELADYKFGRLRGLYKDPMVTCVIRLLAEHEDGVLANIKLEEMAQSPSESSVAVKLSVKDQAVRIEAYPLENSVAEMASDGNYDGLWGYCSGIFKKESISTWKHQTYQLAKLPDRIGNYLYSLAERQGEGVLVWYQAGERRGFFYVTENTLYRIEMSGREQQGVSPLVERVLGYLTEGRQLSDGILWEDKKIKKAVYTSLWEAGAGRDFDGAVSWEDAVFSNEEVTGLKELTINGAGNGENYDDLQFLRELRSLRLCGEEGGRRKLLLYFPEGSLQKLEELAIENCRLGRSLQSIKELPALTKLRLNQCFTNYHKDLGKGSWVWELLGKCKGLKELSLKGDGITDVSGLVTLTNLERLDLSFNEIKNFLPLCKLEKLKSLTVNDNPGKELGELVYVPDLCAGNLIEDQEEMAQAQQVMNEFCQNSQDQMGSRFVSGVQVQDQARGDLNGDGIEDLAVIGIGREVVGKDVTGIWPLGRKVYLFLGTEQGYTQIQTIQLPKPVGEKVGITEADPFCSVAISGEHLIIRIWTEKQDLAVGGMWSSTSIYTWINDGLRPECRNETDYQTEADHKAEADNKTENDLIQKKNVKMAPNEIDGDDRIGQKADLYWEDHIIKEAVLQAVRQGDASLSGKELDEVLKEIRELYIYQFDKVSTLEDLKKLPNLESLILFGEKQDCEELDLTGELVPNLKSLFISNMGIENVDFLRKLPPLTSLYVTMCDLKDISAVGCQEELMEVSFLGNQIENIWPLRSCKKIEKLTLANNRIEDISVLASLEKLYAVELSENQIRNVEVLQWLPQLKSLSLEHNRIQDISVLQGLGELQFLYLSDNLIEDFGPILGMEGLLSFSAAGNPGQNIGNLLFVPHFSLDGGFYEGDDAEKEEAQEYLDLFYAQEKLIAEDMVKGDLNRDGILDVAVVGRIRFSEEEPVEKVTEENVAVEGALEGDAEESTSAEKEDGSEDTFHDVERAVYVFLGQADGKSRALRPVKIDGPYDGGTFGDPYRGIMITEGRLVVQTYGGSSWRWGYTNIYEYGNGTMTQRWELCKEHCVFAGGYDFTVKDLQNGHMWYYVIAGDWEEGIGQLLLAECYDEAYASAAGTGIKAWYGSPRFVTVEQTNREWKRLSESSGIVTPQLYAEVYQPEIGEEYYDYQLHSTFYNTKEQTDRVLDMAAEQFLQSENRIIGECYPTEEIKDNFELLVGVELPSYFYMGYSRKGVPCILCYDGCQQNEDGSYVHKLALVISDGEFWKQKEIISYEEAEEVFVVG